MLKARVSFYERSSRIGCVICLLRITVFSGVSPAAAPRYVSKVLVSYRAHWI